MAYVKIRDLLVGELLFIISLPAISYALFIKHDKSDFVNWNNKKQFQGLLKMHRSKPGIL
jgi:hypothetical protein